MRVQRGQVPGNDEHHHEIAMETNFLAVSTAVWRAHILGDRLYSAHFLLTASALHGQPFLGGLAIPPL